MSAPDSELCAVPFEPQPKVFEMLKTTQLTGGRPSHDATRIDAHCWVDGLDDHLIVEFWHLPGSILRTVYNRRTTCRTESFVPVDSWEFRAIMTATVPSYEI